MLGCRPRAIVAAEPPLLVASSLRGCDEACLIGAHASWRPASWRHGLCLVPGGWIYLSRSRRRQAGRVERGEVLRAACEAVDARQPGDAPDGAVRALLAPLSDRLAQTGVGIEVGGAASAASGMDGGWAAWDPGNPVALGRSTVGGDGGAMLGAPPRLDAPEPGGSGFTVGLEPAPAICGASGAARFHAVLWHRFSAASGRIKEGLDSLSTLSTFVKKRVEAERELAKVLYSMTKGSAWSWGGQKDLQETVNETGRVLQAWEVMMRTTLNTCESLCNRSFPSRQRLAWHCLGALMTRHCLPGCSDGAPAGRVHVGGGCAAALGAIRGGTARAVRHDRCAGQNPAGQAERVCLREGESSEPLL